MSTITELGTFLDSACGATVYRGKLPASPVTAMAIIPYPGREPEFHMNVSTIAIEFPRYQFLSRASDEATALANAETAYRALAGVVNEKLSGTFYSVIRLLQSPGMIMRSENDLPIVGFNFECEKSLS